MNLKGFLCGAAAVFSLAGCGEQKPDVTVLVPPDEALCVDDIKNDTVTFVDMKTQAIAGYGQRPASSNNASHVLNLRADGAPNGLVFAFTKDNQSCEVYSPFEKGNIARYQRVSRETVPDVKTVPSWNSPFR